MVLLTLLELNVFFKYLLNVFVSNFPTTGVVKNCKFTSIFCQNLVSAFRITTFRLLLKITLKSLNRARSE